MIVGVNHSIQHHNTTASPIVPDYNNCDKKLEKKQDIFLVSL